MLVKRQIYLGKFALSGNRYSYMANILLTIAARGGSKGIEKKNIKLLMGKPLIAHTIKQALEWNQAKRVIVSTDSQEIADVAKEYGAEVPFIRPDYLAEDSTPKGPVLKHALTECEKQFNEQYDIVVDLDVTSPLRSQKDLDQCLDLFLKSKPKTLFSVVNAHKNPYFNMVERDKNGTITLCKTIGKGVMRRQDAPEVYSLNASIYFYDRKYLLESDMPYPVSDQSEIYVMDDISGIDIDREIDFKLIEFLVEKECVQI